MTEISAVTPTTPEPPKAPEHKHTREQVVKAFNETFDDFRFSRQPLTPQDEAIVSRIQLAKEKTIDKGKSRAQNKFSNDQTGEQFVTLEGVPIDRLLDYLKTRIESGLLTPEEMTTYKERWDLLNSHKKPFLQGKQLNPSVRLARNQQEAALMSQTTTDISGEVGFWNMAEVELSGRFELILPPKPKVEKTPPITVTPPPLPPIESNPPPLPPEPPVEPPIEPPLPPTTSTVEDVRYELAIGTREPDLEKRARDEANTKLMEKLRGRNIFRRIKYRIAEEYYRQKFTQQALSAMREHHNTYLSMESVKSELRLLDPEAGRANQVESDKAKVEEIKARLKAAELGAEGMATGIRTAEGPLRQRLIETIIRPVINGDLTDPQEVQRTLAAFVQAHADDPVVAELFGSDKNTWGQATEFFATDLLEVGRAIKADFEAHDQSMMWLDQLLENRLDIRLARPQWASATETQKLSRTDRFIKWAQSRRVTGAIFNPAVVGAASSLATFAILRAPLRVASTVANFTAPGAGALSGGLFAAVRRNYDAKVDISSHRVEREYGMQIPVGSRRREKMEEFAYDTVSIADLINGGGNDSRRNNEPRRSVTELVTSDLTNEANQQDLVSRIAEIEARLDYSDVNKVGLITFQSGETIEQGRMELVKIIVEGRQALRTAGVDDSRISVMRTALAHDFETNQAEQDKRFKRYRLRSSLANGAFGSVAGLGAGLVVQEGVALGMRATGNGVGQTVLERAIGYEGNNTGGSRTVDVFRELADRGGSYDPGAELRFNIDPASQTVQITDIPTGRSLIDTPIKISDDGHMMFDGKMPPELQTRLQTANFDILDKTGPPQEITRVIDVPGTPTTSTEIVGGPQAVEQWRQIGTHYDQQQWYRNDTPGVYDLNEHRAYTIKQGDTLILDMSRMHLGTESGLSPNPIDVQNVIQSKEAGFSFKIPGGGNHQAVWIPESADGVADGLLHLDPNDTTHMVTMGDGSQMSIAELSKMIVNQDELAQFNDGDIATEVYNRREVFRLGNNGRKGWWEVGRMTNQNGQTVLQTFATGRGISDAVGVKTTEIPGVPTTRTIIETIPGKPQFEIIPPTVTEVTMAPDPIPLIPIPFAPRHPLERLLFTYGYGGEYGRNNYGLLNENEYQNRFSSRILNNPDAILDEDEEVKDYLSKQQPEYIRELTAMNAQISTPMSQSARVVVAIPAYGEGANIQKLLSSFLGQVDKDGNPINPDVFEIVILENHPDSVSKDSTEEEIRLFTTANPTIRVSYAHKVWAAGEAAVGNARKIANDLALLRSQQRASSDGDLILVSQDADVEGIDSRYIHSLITDFDESPELDAVAGKWNLPDSTLAKPNVRAAQRLWYMLDRVIARDAEGATTDREPRIPGLVGRNSAFKASVYAAVGGYNPKARLAEDLEIGWLMSRARNWDPQRVKYDNTAEVVSNPRRFIAAVAQGIPLIQMYGNFHENTSVRSMDNASVLSLIPDSFNLAMFQKEIDALWSSHQGGQYAHLGIRFEPLLLRTLGMMGVEAKVDGGKVKIVSADKMIKGLEKYDKSKSKVKKGTIPTTPPTVPPTIPTPTGTETPPPTRDRPRIPTETTTPEGARKDLALQINEQLSSEISDNSEVELTGDGVMGFFKSELATKGARLERENLMIEGDRISFEGSVLAKGGSSDFTLTLGVDPTGKLKVTSHTIDAHGILHKAAKGRIEGYVNDLPIYIAAQIKSKIPADWDLDGFEIVDGKLNLKFKKNGAPTLETSPESAVNVTEPKFVVGKSYVSESGRTYEVTGVRINPNGTKRILYKFSGGGLNGKGNFSEGKWNEYIDGGRLKPEVTAAESTVDLGEIPDESKAAFSTEASPAHPKDNKDSVVVDSVHGFIGVFDGAGDHDGASVASRIATEQTKLALEKLNANASQDEVTAAFAAIIAGTKNGHLAHISSHPEHNGMATTGSILKIFEQGGQKRLAVFHAGDSRIYVVNKNGSVQQLTQDHSEVWKDIGIGKITAEEGAELNLALDEFRAMPDGTPEELEQNKVWNYFKKRNYIYRSFGEDENPDYIVGDLPADAEYVVATSDGVHDNLTKTMIEEICRAATDARALASMLVQRARAEAAITRTASHMRTKGDDTTAAVLAV